MLSFAVFSLCIIAATAAPGDGGVCSTQGSGFSDVEKAKIVDVHNELRSTEGSSNMMQMTWNADLEHRAQQWAEQCDWQHGILNACDGAKMGQNMFMSSGSGGFPTMDLRAAIDAWFSEKAYYHYNSKACDDDEMCGHYTQVVWADSFEIGCAWVQCHDGMSVSWQSEPLLNANMFVCDYSPAGNWLGEPIYVKGDSCSTCVDEVEFGYDCENNLCVQCTPATRDSCTCVPRSCVNGGTYDAQHCVCTCPPGFFGKSCENTCVCQDNSSGCSTPSWQALCTDARYEVFLTQNCPVTCGFCNLPPSCN